MGLDAPVRTGDRITVRIGPGIAEEGIDAIDEQIRGGVFEGLGLVMDFVPPVAQRLDEERLDQPVPSHHRQGDGLAPGGQHRRAIGHPFDQLELVESFEHLGDIGLRRSEPIRELGGGHRVPAPFLGRPDGLEVILADLGHFTCTHGFSIPRTPPDPGSLLRRRVCTRTADHRHCRRSGRSGTHVAKRLPAHPPGAEAALPQSQT